MIKWYLLVVSCLFFLLIVSSPAQSPGDAIRILDNQTGFGARALGMGGAYMGVADDYSAIYWNPAGLAQMRKMEFWMSLSHVKFENDILYNTDIRSYGSKASNNATKFNSVGMVFPVPTYRGSLVFALGYHRVSDFEYANEFKGMSSRFSDEAIPLLTFELDTTGKLYNFWGDPVEKSEFISDEGNINIWSAAGAIEVSPNISVGMAINYWTGSSDYQLEFLQVDQLKNYQDYPGNFYDYLERRKIYSKYSSFGVKLSGLLRAGKFTRIGFGMELPQTFNVDEDFLLESSVSFDDGEIIALDYIEDVTEYDVKMPFRFSGGASFAVGPALIAGSIQYTDWTQVKFDAQDVQLTDQNKLFKTEYRETLKWQVGGEVGLPVLDSQFRMGYIYDPIPIKDADSENDRKYFTIGYGVLIDKIFKLDLAYLRGSWKQFTWDEFTPSGTHEDVTTQKLFFTIAYRF
ncbi:MAG: outer membrane protein transport protein [Calditrichia bacterium]